MKNVYNVKYNSSLVVFNMSAIISLPKYKFPFLKILLGNILPTTRERRRENVKYSNKIDPSFKKISLKASFPFNVEYFYIHKCALPPRFYKP